MASHGTNGREVVILGSARTPQGKFLGALSSLSAAELGQVAVKAAVERSGIDTTNVNEVILGNVVSAGVGQALPRQVSIGAGIPANVGGVAINKVCGSGLKAVMLAASAIKAGDGDLFISGGVESMSRAPYLNDHLRQGNKYGHIQVRDALQHDGLWCSLCDWGMGNAAEFIGRQLEVTRDEMDAFALRSHQLAAEATDNDRFKTEIAPVTVKTRKGEVIIDADEPIRRDTSLEALAKLRPAFEDDGSVTAGNAPGMNDGAAALVVSSREYAETYSHQPAARIVGYAQAAVEPAWLFYAPVKAIPLALERAGWSIDDVDLFELNEAFAAQVLADIKGLERDGYHLPMEKLNVNGGAIALGHPLGASGARVLVTLIHALQSRGLKRGLAALCLGGAEAVALAVELCD
ncbi:MAG: acetyl-CoA C-acetyltransferase [Chloroflexi bacterium]|nr:MAG: acetyl-CoA C-acyltransferase [Phototrophicales bacterium]RMF78120.1 MAG: acetyl-CoA C-acetyltransferase [Chloroflexota bacterium]